MAMALEISERAWLEESWMNLSKDELNREMSRYMIEWDTEKAQALLDFMKAKDSPEWAKTYNDSFKEKYDQFQDSMKQKNEELQKLKDEGAKEEEIKAKSEEIQKAREDFFKDDMKSYVDTVWARIQSTEKAKDDEINRLKNQLSGIVSNWPKLSEYLSFKRRRLVTLNDNIAKLEQDKANYPKNVLIYLMWQTKSNIIWVRSIKNGLKRSWIRASWNWNSDNIKDDLKNFEESIKVKSGESQWTIGLKKQLQDHLTKAKQAYVDQQKRSVGL